MNGSGLSRGLRKNGLDRFRKPEALQAEENQRIARIPRDREGTFDPKLIQRYQRRFPGFDDMMVSMCTRGMTVRLQRPVLPFGGGLENCVRDRRNEVRGRLRPTELEQTSLLWPEHKFATVPTRRESDTREPPPRINQRP